MKRRGKKKHKLTFFKREREKERETGREREREREGDQW